MDTESIKEWAIIIGSFGLLIVAVIGLLKWNEYRQNQPKPRHYAYVCPVNDNSSKCYDVPVGLDRACEETGDDSSYCYDTVDTIYWPNGGYSTISTWCIQEKGRLYCTDDEERDWNIEISSRVTDQKYYPDGSLAK